MIKRRQREANGAESSEKAAKKARPREDGEGEDTEVPFRFEGALDSAEECKRILATVMTRKSDEDGNITGADGLFAPEQALLLPSFYSIANALLECRDTILARKVEGVLPEDCDDIITGLMIPMFNVSGPPARSGQLYGLRSPSADVNVCQKENMLKMIVDKDPKTGEVKVCFGTDSSVFKRHHDRHGTLFATTFSEIFYHYVTNVLPRNEKKYQNSACYDKRLEGFAFGEPCTFKPFRAWDKKDGKPGHSGDASKKAMGAFEWAVDELLGKGTYKKFGLHRLKKVYDFRVPAFAANITPGSLHHLLDIAKTEGLVPEGNCIQNQSFIDNARSVQNAVSLSKCQPTYTYKNSHMHAEHANNLVSVFRLVEIRMAGTNKGHLEERENSGPSGLRAHPTLLSTPLLPQQPQRQAPLTPRLHGGQASGSEGHAATPPS